MSKYYTERSCRTLKQVRDSIPPRLFARNTLLGLAYYTRDVALAVALFFLAVRIDRGVEFFVPQFTPGTRVVELTRWVLWVT